MGLDVRDIPRSMSVEIPERLRIAGFNTQVKYGTSRTFPGAIITRIFCKRGDDVQEIYWHDGPNEPAICRIYIAMARGWLESNLERRIRLQDDVTEVIEQAGGRFPSQ